MKKRVVSLLLCLIMALSLIPTAAFATDDVPDADIAPADEVQVQAAATGEVAVQKGGDKDDHGDHSKQGTKLSWNYAIISQNGSGYTVSRPNTSNDLSTHVTVTFNGNNQAKGSTKYYTMSATDTGDAVVTADEGYYIAYVVLCCDDQDGYHCQTSMGENAYGKAGSPDGRTVTIKLSEIYANANHKSGKEVYWLMVMVKQYAKPAYVGYDAGTLAFDGQLVDHANDTTWVGTYDTQKYTTAGEEHTVLGISKAAQDAAAKANLEFAGWMLTYYNKYTETGNAFDGEVPGRVNIPTAEKDTIKLFTHAKLVAQWKEAPKPITGTLTVTKNVTGETSVAPTEFTITVKGPGTGTSAKTYTETVTAGNSVTFKELPFGSYTITEADASATKDGYSWTETISNKTVTISDTNLNPTVTVTNNYKQNDNTKTVYNPASLTIKKVDSDTKEVLDGAVFELRKGTEATAASVGTFNLTSNSITGIDQAGTFYLYETTAPAGYVKPDTFVAIVTVSETTSDAKWDGSAWVTTKTYKVTEVSVGTNTLTPNTDGAYQITNDKAYGDDVVNPSQLIVVKKDARTDALLSGAAFQLYKMDAAGNYEKVNAPVVTGANGTIVFKNLNPGKYQLKETQVPKDASGTDYVGWGDRAFEFSVVKGNELATSPRLNGEKYEKVFASNIVFDKTDETFVRNDGFIFYKNYSFANNELTIYNEKLETVTLPITKEVESLYASAPTDTEFKFYVELMRTEDNNIYEFDSVQLLSKFGITVDGKPLEYDEKADAYFFTMTAGKKDLTISGTRNDLHGLAVTVYEDETAASANWTNDETRFGGVLIYMNGQYNFTDSDGEIINPTFTFTNTYDNNPETSVTVTKEWELNGISEAQRPAKITVQLMQGNKAYGDPVDLYATNDWTYTWTGLKVYNATGSKIVYSVKEIDVPTGFNDKVIEIATADHPSFIITNAANVADKAEVVPASLTVIKTDANDGTKLEGAKFVLIREGAVATDSPIVDTDKDGKAVFENLTAGKYTLKEVTAPEGYQVTDQTWTITVSDDAQTAGYVLKDGKFVKTVTCKVDDVKDVVANGSITITNVKATGTVTIDKVLKGLNPTDFDDGFAFEIKDASGKVVATVEKVFPDMTTPATVTLVPGTYTIVEKSADKDGYDLTTEYDKETFTVEAGKNVTVTVTNTYTKKVTPPPTEYTLSVDIQKNIELKRSSSRKPGKASFTFEAYLVDEKGNETILNTVTIDTKGTKSADGTLTFTLTEDDLSITGHGIVYVREVKGSTRGWTYDDTVYMLGVEVLDGKLHVYAVDKQRVDEPVTLEFTNVYYKRSTTTGGDDKPIQSVKTGDMGIAMYAMTSLLSLGGAALVIKKRKEEK